MALFHYTALDKTGTFVKGQITANQQKQATGKLEQEGFAVVNLRKERNSRFDRINQSIVRITRLDMIFFTRHLYTLLESGIALDQALHITAEQNSNLRFREILLAIHKRVKSGQSLSSSLSQHKDHFSDFFINMVKIGESSGKLDDVLLHSLEQQEKDHELLTKMRGAMIYPSIIVTAALIMVTLMMAFVVPKISDILSEYEVGLPLTTRALMATSYFVVHYGLVAIPLAVVLLVLGFRYWVRQPWGKSQWDGLKLKLPLVKRIVVEFNNARLARAMASLLKSGVAMDKALSLAMTASGNKHYHSTMADGVRFIQKGIALSEVLKGRPDLYPPITLRMLEVGEKTGQIDEMFDRLANYYEKSVSNTLSNLSTIIEPVLLIFIGCVVALIGLAVLTPIWKFSETV